LDKVVFIASQEIKRVLERTISAQLTILIDGRRIRLMEEIEGGADVTDTYPIGDREERRRKEQQAINDKGGLSETVNRRNEIRETKWGNKGVKPPPPKPPEPKPQEPKTN
jgi:hypothetical protein